MHQNRSKNYLPLSRTQVVVWSRFWGPSDGAEGRSLSRKRGSFGKCTKNPLVQKTCKEVKSVWWDYIEAGSMGVGMRRLTAEWMDGLFVRSGVKRGGVSGWRCLWKFLYGKWRTWRWWGLCTLQRYEPFIRRFFFSFTWRWDERTKKRDECLYHHHWTETGRLNSMSFQALGLFTCCPLGLSGRSSSRGFLFESRETDWTPMSF